MRPRFVRVPYSRTFPYPVPEAFAWLTDYQDDDPLRTTTMQKARRVLSRTKDLVVAEAEIEFRGIPIRSTVEVRLHPPDRYVATFASGRLRGSVYEYRLTKVPGGCRLDVDHRFRVTRFKAWLQLLLVRPMLRREIHTMWEGYAAAMEKEIPAAASAVVPS